MQETKDSEWRFKMISSMIIFFCKAVEKKGSSFVKVPVRSSSILKTEIKDKYYFTWSNLAYLHPISDSENG